MKTLLLLGGDSLRFLAAGYTMPKACLPGPRGPIIQSVIEGLAPDWLITAGRKRDFDVVASAVQHTVGQWRIWTPVWCDGPAQGPLYGLLDAERLLGHLPDSELVISYCDVILGKGITELLAQWRGHESGAVTFHSCDPRFGYWANGRVHEKQLVSNWAVSGVFYFQSARAVLERARRVAQPGMGIVDLLDSHTALVERQASEIIDIGTPDAYERYMLESVRI